MKFGSPKIVAALFVTATIIVAALWWPSSPPRWTDEEVEVLKSLWLASLPELSPDPSNAVADNPAAAEFGRKLFFDTRLSANGGISCATCHQAERGFTDGLQKAQAIGTTNRHTPSIVGSAYSPWQFWDGRSDSQWSQALAPLEDPNEHGTNRAQVVALVAGDDDYRASYEYLFGELPEPNKPDALALNTAFANVGKAIASFERTIMPTTSRFDEYVAAVVDRDTDRQSELFSDDEALGLRLFIGVANCTQCHNGPLFTNFEFHNTGVISFPGDVPDKARVSGVVEVLASEFSCRGPYSDDPQRRCSELEFARTGAGLIGAFKTPSLRNLAAPFMHKGHLATLADVVNHYNQAPDAMIGHNEATPLGFNDRK
ncbi:MAG: cytochrome-c peroxidase, partial [Woeseiaceae bacterium]|nr:cytochrome-c peroxidase [Woeseiaceae bacterium]